MKSNRCKIKTWIYGIFVFIIMCGIFFFSSQNGESSGDLSNHFLLSLIGGWIDSFMRHFNLFGQQLDLRKFAHMFEYFILGFFSCLFFREIFLERKKCFLLMSTSAIALCFVYACSDEWHQTFVDGRYGCFRDVMIDGVGFVFSILLLTLLFSADNYIKKKRYDD